MKYTPVRGKVLVKVNRPPVEYKTASGLILADFKIKDRTRYEDNGNGTVLAVGECRQNKDGSLFKHTVKVGDKVFWIRHAEVYVDNKDDLAVLEEVTIQAISEE